MSRVRPVVRSRPVVRPRPRGLAADPLRRDDAGMTAPTTERRWDVLPEPVALEDTVASVDPGPVPPSGNGELREAAWLLKHAI